MKIEMRNLFQNLNPKEYENIEIKNISVGEASLKNVKTKVFQRINMEENNMKDKRKSLKISWVAAILILAIGTTAFAFSKPEYFKGIFGENAKISQENIQDIVVTTSNEDFIFTVESLFSDGNQNYFIISLEGKKDKEIKDTFEPDIRIGGDRSNIGKFASMQCKKINGPYESINKKYYLFTVVTDGDLIGKDVELVLNSIIDRENAKEIKFKENLSVSFNIGDNNQSNIKTIVIDETNIIDEKYYITEIKISNLGLNLTGKELETTKDIPTPTIKLKYKNGGIKTLSHRVGENENSDFPNIGHSFLRDQNNKRFKNTIIFGELIDINDIENIIVEGTEYSLEQ